MVRSRTAQAGLYALLNAGFTGLTLIDRERVYEAVRLCQVGHDGTDRCAPK